MTFRVKDTVIEIPVSTGMRNQLGRVGVLLGGQSAEREVSLQSGNAVLNGLLQANVDAIAIDVDDNALHQIAEQKLDRVFIMLHGPGGEDGRVQALLSYLHLPYTGSGVQASALAMDKMLCKQLWKGMELPTADFQPLRADSDWPAVLQQLGGKAMVKPAHEGSSIGMTLVSDPEQLQSAYDLAAQYDDSVIAERFLDGEEFTVTILDGEALPAIKLETDNQFYDFQAKYESDDTRYLCPCGLSASQEEELNGLALRAFHSLGCKGWGRVDVMTDSKGCFYVLEVNTVPGMTSHSLVPISAKAAGMTFPELVVRILMSAGV